MSIQQKGAAERTAAERDAAERRRRLVVVGNGMAGARAVEEILARGGGERFAITVFGDEPHGNYNRILLSNVLSGSQDTPGIFLHPATWYAENGVTLHTGERVTAIDRAARTVTGASGRVEGYDLLLFATGSRPRIPAVEGLRGRDGAPRPGCFVFRTLDDCRRIAAHARESRRAVVIGGGLLGLEAAYGLMASGVKVDVVHRSGHLMDRQLDPEAGAILRGVVERLGIRVHLSRETAAVEGSDRVAGIRLQDGGRLPCDMVVLACGVRPNVELAAACGLRVERAVLVDDQLRTSDPSVYAVGECVQHRGEVYGLVGPLWEQARVLAEHLTGRNPGARYEGSRPATRLKVAGLEVVTIGATEARDEADEEIRFSEPRRGVYKKLIVRDGALAGAILLGEGAKAPYLMQLFDRGTPVPEERAALFFDLGGRPGAVPLDVMTDEATVCHCNGVRRGDIRECVEGGGCSLHSVMRATRAGTGCGSCKTLIRELVDRFTPRAAPAAAGQQPTGVAA